MRFTDDYRIKRSAGNSMSGCHGTSSYDRITGPNLYGCPQSSTLDAECLLDRALGTGSIVRITIEILHEEPLTKRCINPWSGHAGRGEGYVNASCIGVES